MLTKWLVRVKAPSYRLFCYHVRPHFMGNIAPTALDKGFVHFQAYNLLNFKHFDPGFNCADRRSQIFPALGGPKPPFFLLPSCFVLMQPESNASQTPSGWRYPGTRVPGYPGYPEQNCICGFWQKNGFANKTVLILLLPDSMCLHGKKNKRR